jgi:outer membrane protein assembly factor BamB
MMPTCAARAADQPQWGEKLSRNMISQEKGLPETFDPATGLNVKWSVELGTETYSTPVVAGGRVLIGTNNDRPRDPRHKRDCGVLMCFDEKDGAFQWQLAVPKLGPSPYLDWPHTGLVSPCTVEGDCVYLVTNRNEVMCLDLKGMSDGNDGPYRDEGRHMAGPDGEPEPVDSTDADILWLFDMDRELGVHQHDAAHCSVLLDGRCLYVCTSNGVDDTHKGFPSPDAPSLVVLSKISGRLVAWDDEHMGRRTIHCTWSSPSMGEVNGRRLVFFGGGDGVCYAFEAIWQDGFGRSGPAPQRQKDQMPPLLPTPQWWDTAPAPAAPEELYIRRGRHGKLKCVWRFDCDPAAPRENVLSYQDNRREGPSNITGMPVFHQNRVYVAAGGDLWHGKPQAWLKCIDATGTGDITKTGEVWSYPLERHCMSTPAIWNGLVFIGDCGRKIHCVDAQTGRGYWTHEARGEVWASPLVADGRVYVATRAGELIVLAASKEKRLIASVRLDGPLNGCPVAANGTLYVTTMTRLYAIAR